MPTSSSRGAPRCRSNGFARRPAGLGRLLFTKGKGIVYQTSDNFVIRSNALLRDAMRRPERSGSLKTATAPSSPELKRLG